MSARRCFGAMLVAVCVSLSPAAAHAATKTVRYGPFTVGAGSMDNPTMVTKLRLAVSKPCGDCYITAFHPNLVYGDGSTADMSNGMVMLHHAVFASQWRSDTTCSGTWLGLAGERFFASGNERSAIDLPTGYGYRQRWYDVWNLLVELMNHSMEDKTVYLAVTYSYRPLYESVKPVRPVWLDMNLCGDSEYSISAGEDVQTRDWTSTISGDVVGMIGHVHAWGVRVSTTNLRNGQVICDSWAHKDEMQEVMSMDVCTGSPTLGTIHNGDTLRLTSVYHSDVPRDDVMGIMLGYVHRTG
jgi:hypothetical protein